MIPLCVSREKASQFARDELERLRSDIRSMDKDDPELPEMLEREKQLISNSEELRRNVHLFLA